MSAIRVRLALILGDGALILRQKALAQVWFHTVHVENQPEEALPLACGGVRAVTRKAALLREVQCKAEILLDAAWNTGAMGIRNGEASHILTSSPCRRQSSSAGF